MTTPTNINEELEVRYQEAIRTNTCWKLSADEMLAAYAMGRRNFKLCEYLISGANLSGANLRAADLSGANLSAADLSAANLSGANLRAADLSGADLSAANLSRADLSAADLSAANLSGANLSRANLSGANLSGADLSRADLSGADLSGADLSGANLRVADLSEADLSGADLSEADLSGANLSRADLSGANLRGADLSGADLSGANLRVADLSEADLSGAEGIPNPIDYLEKNFEWTDEGLIAYKTFGSQYSPNAAWKIEPGAVLNEVVNPCPGTDCACGINVAPLAWVKREHPGQVIWKALIRHRWLSGVIVPFQTDGKIRASRVELVGIVGAQS